MEAVIKSRIDADLKAEVEGVLAALGMTVSDVIRITFRQIAARKGLPFDVKIPNAETQNVLVESDDMAARMRAGEKPRFDSIDAYFAFMEARTTPSKEPKVNKG